MLLNMVNDIVDQGDDKGGAFSVHQQLGVTFFSSG
jgi:hypothetical protein